MYNALLYITNFRKSLVNKCQNKIEVLNAPQIIRNSQTLIQQKSHNVDSFLGSEKEKPL